MTDPATPRPSSMQVAILVATAFFTISVAVACIVLSYHGLYELSLTKSTEGGQSLAWIWPIIPDGLLIVGSTAVLYGEVFGTSDDVRKAWLMVAAGTIISIAAQVTIAGDESLGALLVAAAPPTVLAIVWAFLMRMVRRAVKPAQRPRTAGKGRVGAAARAAPSRTGLRRGTGTGPEVDGPGAGDGLGSSPPVRGREVQRVGNGTGAIQLRAGSGPGRQDASGPGTAGLDTGAGTDPEERRRRAWQLMAADRAAGRRRSGAELAETVGGITDRTARKWQAAFDRQHDHGGLSVVK